MSQWQDLFGHGGPTGSVEKVETASVKVWSLPERLSFLDLGVAATAVTRGVESLTITFVIIQVQSDLHYLVIALRITGMKA